MKRFVWASVYLLAFLLGAYVSARTAAAPRSDPVPYPTIGLSITGSKLTLEPTNIPANSVVWWREVGRTATAVSLDLNIAHDGKGYSIRYVLPLTTGPDPVPPVPPGPTPPPIPPVPPVPDVVAQAEKLAFDAAQKLPPAGRAADAARLAIVYRDVASKIPNPVDTPAKLVLATRAAKEFTLGPDRVEFWAPWAQEVGTWLDTLDEKTVKDMAGWKAVWEAISKGLGRVK